MRPLAHPAEPPAFHPGAARGADGAPALRGRAAALGSPHRDAMTDFEGRLEQR